MRHQLSLTRRRGLLGLAAAATALQVAKQPAWADAPNQAATAPVQRLADALLRVMKQNLPFEQRVSSLAPVIEQTFDLDAILAASVGSSWPTLPGDQKAALSAAFRRYTFASYASSFDKFDGQRFEISPNVRSVGNGEVVVQSKIVPADGSATPLHYVMRDGPSGWKAVDVLAGGTISRVAVQRSDFRSLLASGGVPALMTALQRKVANLQAA